jgi:DNA-binding transcriptional MerR regulator
MNVSIPQKSSFTFSEVSSISEVKPYVLRFWESEFNQIDPVMSDAGSKIYDLKDLYAVLKIKDLLFNQKLSIPKAKLVLMETGIEMEKEEEALDMENRLADTGQEIPPVIKVQQPVVAPVLAASTQKDSMKEALKVLTAAKAEIARIKERSAHWL